MKSISKLKDEARRYEQREEWEKAIQTYLQVLRAAEDDETEVDLPLYNRLGDLCVRLGRPEEAVRHYEHAADRYAEVGLYNNAIALCNKALRYDRDRPELIRKLGQFSASQGFVTDARRYFLDYAERQFNTGRVEDALSALEDFADVADDPEVREMLGRRLHAHGRTEAAVKELRRAHEMRAAAGDTVRANALLAELRAMDPNAAAAADPVAPDAPPAPAPMDEPAAAEPPPLTAAADDLPLMTEPESDFEIEPFEEPAAPRIEGFEPGELEPPAGAPPDTIEGLEQTGTAAEFAIDTSGIEGLETGTVDFSLVEPPTEDLGLMREETSFGDALVPDATASSGESFDLPLLDDEPPTDLPLLDDQPPSRIPADLPFLDDEPPSGLVDDLPLLDDDSSSGMEDDLPLLDDDASAGIEDDLPLLADASSSGITDDLPLLDDESPLEELPLLGDGPEATPAPAAQRDEALAPIDLGTDFSFDLGSFGITEPAVDLPPLGDEAASAAGADDDGISLPDVDDDTGFDFDVAAPARDVSSGGTDPGERIETEDGLPAPAVFGGADDAGPEPTFDGADVPEAQPSAWEPDPAPGLELPVDPEPSGLDGALDVLTPEEPAAFDIPELPDLPGLAEQGAEPLPFGGEPQDADRVSGVVDEPTRIPDIELPTWESESARAVEADADRSTARVEDAELEPYAAFAADLESDAGDEISSDAGPGFTTDTPDPAEAASDAATDWLTDGADDFSFLDAEMTPGSHPAGESAGTVATGSGAAETRSEEAAPPASADPGDDFIDLGALVTGDGEAHSTRFRIRETAPTGDEDQDFAELLSQFKAKVHEHLPPEDASAHYDLGLAFKEMGLVEEAIGEFQVALRAGHMRLRVYEELGECFLMKEQYNIAEKVLTRALQMRYDDELELLGVYYHLGRAYEALGRKESARDAYERVLGMDINFEDVTARLARL